MKYRTVFIFSVLILITGCRELFYRQSNCPPGSITAVVPALSPPIKVITVVHREIIPAIMKKNVLCNLLPGPENLPLPVAPNTKPGEILTDKQRIILMQDYIRTLQGYIKDQRDTEVKSYQNYIKGCVKPRMPE